jgi:5-deoxy-glucuronate isomerase
MTGKVELAWDSGREVAARRDIFSELPWVLHVAKGKKVTVVALEDAEILLQSTTNPRDFPSKLYRPADSRSVVSCEGKWENTAVRDVITTIDYENAPYSNLVIGEVVQRQGRWAGYIPHHHPQPEVYYFRFDKPQGFGASFIGDDAHKITDGSFAAIPGGLSHPQVTAPGYRLYFCWMIRHLDGNPWTDRIDVDEHKWLLDAKF